MSERLRKVCDNRGQIAPALARICFLLLPTLMTSSVSEPQNVQNPTDHPANDVVMLSLGAMNSRASHQRHVREMLTANSAAESNIEKRLLEIQMNIVRETAKFGPVLLLAPDETTKDSVKQRCAEFQICSLLTSDRVRIKVAAHDGLWIRDFGPEIEMAGASANVTHWRYFDIRSEEAKTEKAQELETARLQLLEAREQEDEPETLSSGANPDARKAAISTIEAKLYTLKEYSQLLSETSPQRTNDENAAYGIADAVLAQPGFQYKSSGVALDGGNLLKLDDGRCLTTRVLLARNKDQNINVDEELMTFGGCKEVTYLEPLPGPVIEHVDMFALPVSGKRILLASYDPGSPFAKEYWRNLSDAERELAMDAELAMELNAERLRRLGYVVVRVASPFPRIPENGQVYYPSMLNALVREGSGGNREVLVPTYEGYEEDIQVSTIKEIAAAFGPKAELVKIEATAAAMSQGGAHCLTLTAPLRGSIFGDSEDVARRTAIMAQEANLDRNAAAEMAAEIPRNGLLGSWAIVEEGDQTRELAAQFFPRKIYFGEREFQKGVLDHMESKGKYTISKREETLWSLRFEFSSRETVDAVGEWVNRDELRLIFGDGSSGMLLRRISGSTISPFKGEHLEATQDSPRSGARSIKPSKAD
jgi:agmatine/peptidylarginine deiminase